MTFFVQYALLLSIHNEFILIDNFIIFYNLPAQQMIDKGKYAAHGVFIKKLDQNFVGNWSKPKNAVINPIPTTVPRQKPQNQQQQNMKVNSSTFNAKFKFQQPIVQKPIPQDLIQPFLYIEKVIKKRKVDEEEPNQTQIKGENNKKGKNKQKDKNKLKPFIIPKNDKISTVVAQKRVHVPQGYGNLHELQTDKRNTANLIFQKMLQADIDNVKQIFNLWNKDSKRNLTADINIKEQQFVKFVQQLIPNKVTAATIKHFFELYKNKSVIKKTEAKDNKEIQQKAITAGEISIRAFSYNYHKYRKAETEITNIMSEKAAKSRYQHLKKYVSDFLGHYPELKVGMQGMKQYEETLRKHFRRLYQSYKNPFEDEINSLKAELQKPIIKYDKQKKQKTEKKIEEYQNENSKIYSKLTQDFNNFIYAYEQAIVKNHDLLFTKRTVAHLLWPVIQAQPLLTRQLIEKQVQVRQQEKQKYLECLSDIVVEIDNDKKHLVEDCFTLGEIVQLVKMKFRNKKTKENVQLQQFTIESLKKLIKQIKRQYLLKFNLSVENLDNFPADQQIPLQILHTCFEMQCTKVLFKNKIWSQLLQMLPTRSVDSRLHQKTIDSNTCMEYLNKYFKKLDQRMSLERVKSKEISLLVENAYNQNFGKYAQIINKVFYGLDHFVQGIEEQETEEKQKDKKKKKVGFADIVDAKLSVDRGEKHSLQKQQDIKLVNDVIKLIHMQAQGLDFSLVGSLIEAKNNSNHQIEQHDSPHKALQALQMIKSMARSYFEPEAMNTNAFDIRYYEKMAEQQKSRLQQPQVVVELGKSMILSGAPRPEDIQGSETDPLRISRFLLKTIDKDVKEQQKELQNKDYQKDIYQGVSNNYFRQKIKLQNKPTRFDSEGKSKYSVLLPVGYYESYIVGQSVPDQQKWYLRPHHVQTLTQNPLSKKDNVIHTEYQSKLEKLGLKKRPDEFVIQENVKRKQGLISELEQRIMALKKEVNNARRGNDIPGYKVKPALVNEYYNNITEGKEDKQLEMAAYEGVLYDLRRKERQLLNKYRTNESHMHGEPNQKWWQRKDKDFNREARKDRQLIADESGVHKSYVQKLKNNEVY